MSKQGIRAKREGRFSHKQFKWKLAIEIENETSHISQEKRIWHIPCFLHIMTLERIIKELESQLEFPHKGACVEIKKIKKIRIHTKELQLPI